MATTNEDYEQDLAYTPYVFVYGTLQRGYSNSSLLDTADFMCEAKTDKEFFLCNVGFPYAIPKANLPSALKWISLPVLGEVWKLCAKTQLMNLDALEGVSSGHYQRDLVYVNDQQYYCWVYVQTDLSVLGQTDECKLVEGAWKW